MSVTSATKIACDHKGCSTDIVVYGMPVSIAVNKVAKKGWHVERNRDCTQYICFCPRHVPMEESKK